MAWSKPYRPKTENGVTQPLTSGIVTIYGEKNIALPGYLPQVQFDKKVTLRYEERSLGLQRYFNARQNQVQVERVIRCPRYAGVTNQDVAETEDGGRYRIDMVQAVMDVYPPCMDLTLARYEQVPDGEAEGGGEA